MFTIFVYVIMIFRFFWVAVLFFSIEGFLHANTSLIYDALKSGIGIRAASMGYAFSSIADGRDALYFNPAGLSVPGFSYSYQNLDYQNQYYNKGEYHSVFSSPLAYGNWSIEDKDQNSVNVNSFAFGRKGSKGVDWGLTYKSVNSSVDGSNITGWTSDLGLLVHLFPFMDLGFVGRDFIQGDINDDQVLNISDVILLIDFILENTNPNDEWLVIADMNDDGIVNVLDVILIVELILS